MSIKIQCQYINLVWLQISFLFSIFDHSDHVSSQEEDTSSINSNSPRFTQLTTQTTGLNSGKLEICREEQASCEWTEYDDFPSSEDLSAFLTDLELDTINKISANHKFQDINQT